MVVSTSARLGVLVRGWVGLWLVLIATATGARAAPLPWLEVGDQAALGLWPAVSVLREVTGTLRVEALIDAPDRFAAPEGTPGNLGRLPDPLWLRIPLRVEGIAPLQRVLEIDYPSLNHIEVYTVQHGKVLAMARMGSELPPQARPLRSSSHATGVTLPPGDCTLYLRVRTVSSMVLPLSLRTTQDFLAQEVARFGLQGVLMGLFSCMLIYTLTQWVGLRDRLFLWYALMLAGNAVYLMSFFGIGPLCLWTDHPQWTPVLSLMGMLLALAGGVGFARASLEVDRTSPWLDRVLGAARTLALTGLVALPLGWVDYRVAHTATTTLCLLCVVSVIPVAYARSAQGHRSARYMLLGWTVYSIGGASLVALLRGWVAPSFWSQHLYAFSMVGEMAAWMLVLGQRVQAIHRSADRAQLESDTMRALAHTDALTGLPNRRGLQDHLAEALHRCTLRSPLAIYLLDLDGFKHVNDLHGHAVGDALLVEAGKRLQAQLRHSDVVARLGGDEFVVLARGVETDGGAQALGDKMLTAFEEPFEVMDQRCDVGLTIGYVLAPQDGLAADSLLRSADAAMYRGKAAGRRRVVRAESPLPSHERVTAEAGSATCRRDAGQLVR